MTTNNTLTYRVGELEKCADKMDTNIDLMLRNHLPHMQSEIESLKTRINVLTVVNTSAIIVGLLFAKYL